MFIPTTKEELNHFGWDKLDIILITGDTYIDSPFIGISIIGKVLIASGFRVGIIAQPDINSSIDITRLGEPLLFWGVTSGSVDSMVANYTAIGKRRKKDDFTPGGQNILRPDRAAIVYVNLIRRFFKDTKPIVLGGIEASLRRIAHYDFWSNKIRKSILFNAKADILIYGMGERAVLEIARCIRDKKDIKNIRGICYISREKKDNFIELPSYEMVEKNKQFFIEMFNIFYRNNDPITACGLYQKQDMRYLIQNPPQLYFDQKSLDEVYDLNYERGLHPFYKKKGDVVALDTIKFSITTHRGCYGECNFCAITIHQGNTIRWRSEKSILKEARRLCEYPDFKGYINDLGGPTANMYGFECTKKILHGSCQDKRCLYPTICSKLRVDHSRQIELLKDLRKIKKIKKIFISSGIRYDLICHDKRYGQNYLKDVVAHHVSGQIKVAPEHCEDKILKIMMKTDMSSLLLFREIFYKYTKTLGKKQFLTYYFMVAHPGCTQDDMKRLKEFVTNKLKINPKQVQIYTPTPSTYSSLMYYTEINPFTGEKLFVEKRCDKKQYQKDILLNESKRLYRWPKTDVQYSE